ncbi:MAG: DUF1015 family protein [Acidobacteria bacterium]|nr:DUF1015 family protein [Acidobacteriota bacterium]
MAVLRKFKAWRPGKGLEKQVASYPYDVINSEEARELVKDNPFSFLHVVKPEVDLPPGTDLYSQAVYDKALENFKKFLSDGTLIQDAQPKLYLYRQTMDGREQYGIVGCVSVEDYNNDIIKKHEHTRPTKEEDRIRHVDTINANAGPIFLTYRARTSINALVKEAVQGDPLYDFVADDGIGHTVWVVNDAVGERLIDEFKKVNYLYVADGHHRSASAAKVAIRRRDANPNHRGDEEYNFFLAVLFPDEQLRILDYNRVLKHLNNHSREELFTALQELFSVENKGFAPFKPGRKGEVGMYMGGEWFKLTVKPGLRDEKDPVNSLDIAFLQNRLLRPFFGIQDPRTSDDIDFIGGIRGLKELVRLVDAGQFKAAFAIYPTSIEELMNIADAGKVMPPKSTWFEPKLRSGLLVHTLD